MTKQDLRDLIWELPDLDLSNPEDREVLYAVFEPLTKGYFQDAVIVPTLSTGMQVDGVLRVLHLMAAFVEIAHFEGQTKYLDDEGINSFSSMCKQVLHALVEMPDDSLD